MFTPLIQFGSQAFSAYALLLILTSAASAFLGLRVVAREQGSRISWCFFTLTALTSWWLMGRALSSSAPDETMALAWVRLSYLAESLLPAALIRFACIAAGRERDVRRYGVPSWSIAGLLMVLSLTTNFIISGVWHYRWGYFPRYGPGALLFVAFAVAMCTISVWVFVSSARSLHPGRRRRRLNLFAVAYTVGALAGLDFLAAIGLPVPPLGPIAIVITIAIVDRTIRRFQLYDITPAFAAGNIISAMPDALLVADDEGVIRIVNEALCSLSGFRQSELLGSRVESLIPADPDRHGAGRVDGEMRRRDGEAIPVAISRSPLEDAGREVGMVLIARDLRERRRIEASLREQELRLRTESVRRTAELQYRTLVESMSEGILQIDRQNIVRYVNQPAAELSGRTAEEVIGSSIFDFIGEEAREILEGKLKLRQQGLSDRYELEIIAAGGRRRWVEITGSPFYDAFGEPAGSLGIITDITSRHLAQQQLAASARQWQDTFDAIQMPIVILDADHSVRHANRAARERAGNGSEARVGFPVRDFGTDGLWAEIDRLARSTERSGRVQFGGSEGSETWDIVVDVLDQAGHENQMVVSAREITAIIELQESLRRSETLSALGELVGGVAHEVRNPLFAISSTLDAFEDMYRQHDEYRSFALTMRRQIDRLSGLMSGLLDFGRPASSALTSVDVRTVVRDAISLCADDASVASVQVVLLAGDQPLTALADPRRLAVAFRNLIHNALQFAPPESVVEVRLNQGAGENGAAAIFTEVRDHGPGFEELDLPYVFDPFFTRRVGGTGLGLSTTRVIIEQHEGTISAANAPDGGAIVRVELPSLKSAE